MIYDQPNIFVPPEVWDEPVMADLQRELVHAVDNMGRDASTPFLPEVDEEEATLRSMVRRLWWQHGHLCSLPRLKGYLYDRRGVVWCPCAGDPWARTEMAEVCECAAMAAYLGRGFYHQVKGEPE